MKKVFMLLLLSVVLLSVCAPSFAATYPKDKISKLQKEVSSLQVTLAKTKSAVQRARIQKTIAGHKKVIAELQKQLPAEAAPAAGKPVQLQVTKAELVAAQPKIFSLKGGLAGGAGLIAVDYMMPVGPMYLGGEAGYSIGNNFGVIVAGVKSVFNFGGPYVGLEVSYGGYSKKVQDVPGLSGVIDSGVGVGLIAGTVLGPIAVDAGYDTKLGARANVGYRMYL